jgi:hypothetical protein
MALRSAAHGLISRRRENFGPRLTQSAPGLLLAALLTLVIAAPWLPSGYWFGTDWPGPRHFAFPTEISSSYLLELALAAIGQLIGGEATGKLFVIGVLFVAGLAAYEGALVEGFVARAAGAVVFVVNPFVYGRLHYGQLYLLAGFAILPWVAAHIRRLLSEPSLKTGAWAAFGFVLLGILSLHLFLASIALAAVVALAYVAWAGDKWAYLRRVAPHGVFVAGAALIGSSYWIVPLLRGTGYEGSRLTGIGTGDVRAFAAIADQQVGLLPNLLGLYGFWAEASGRFTSMKAFVTAWPVILTLLLALCVMGALFAFRNRNHRLAPWAAGLLATAAVALVLEMGVSHPLTAGFVQWLDAHFFPYRGMRDAGKWAAILALVYSQLAGLGAVAILGWLRKITPRQPRSQWLASVTAGFLLALPLYYGNALLYGAHGEIKPSQYPPGWYAAERVMAHDGHPGRALFLPWHLYMAYSFIQNQNKVVAPPAPAFFSVPVLVSADPEVGGVTPAGNHDQLAVTELVRSGRQGRWSEVLTSVGVRYILVAREVDWEGFLYLDEQPGIVKVGDFGSIILYRNDGPTQALGPPIRRGNSVS